MKKTLKRICFLFVLGFLGLILIQMLYPFGSENRVREKARHIKAKYDLRQITALLKQNTTNGAYVTNVESYFNFLGVSEGDFAWHTNGQGQILDPWQSPYRIEILQQTNFAVRCAGTDKIFGNADDIVFNSISNDFVKP
jgi:hypothetical protein